MNCKQAASPQEPRAARRVPHHVQSFKFAARADRNFRPVCWRNLSELLPQILRGDSPAQIQPFEHFAPSNSPRINTSEKFPIPRISLIRNDFKSTRINTSGNKDLKGEYGFDKVTGSEGK
jgi:hypothetical protein